MKRALGFMNKVQAPAFVSTWNTNNTSAGSSTSTQVKLPIYNGGTYNFVVDWGDSSSSTITAWNDVAVTHTYSASGIYTITITGVCTGWRFNYGGDRLKITSISSWGILKLGNLASYFYGCSNLNLSSVSDVLDLTGMTNFINFFTSCTSLTTIGNFNLWNTSSVTTMDSMFNGCSNFNQNIGSWNTSSVTNMANMFYACVNFNQNIGSWNTSSVTNMANMFTYCTNFNQNIGSWSVSNVSFFNEMFSSPFGAKLAFNNGGSSDIGNWTIKNTGSVNMSGMFWKSSFNQNIGSWNTQAVTNMSYMFHSCDFNQNIGSWNVSAVTDFSLFMESKAPANFSTTNLDAIYNGWSSRSVLANKTITFGTAKYTSASSAGRAILTGAPNNWSITDGGI